MNDHVQPAFIADYQSCFEQTWSDNSDPECVRFVVLDCETTGTDPRRDKLISIGAVVVEAGEIVLEDSFEVLLKVAYNASAVTVHGITRDEAADGLSEAEALTAFLPWLRDGVIVGHHIGFDITMIDLACQQLFNFELRNRSLDTMALTLLLEEDGAFKDQQKIQCFSLDALCSLFGVIPHDRHTAGGDAFITAQVFLRLLRLAKRHGRINLGELCEPFKTMD
jgi:DNA polymerase-3 subunit epsilon